VREFPVDRAAAGGQAFHARRVQPWKSPFSGSRPWAMPAESAVITPVMRTRYSRPCQMSITRSEYPQGKSPIRMPKRAAGASASSSSHARSALAERIRPSHPGKNDRAHPGETRPTTGMSVHETSSPPAAAPPVYVSIFRTARRPAAPGIAPPLPVPGAPSA
jgi:hypothetical protein